jgi:16S rRNA A1518/A1519 N6-dimethyltransferase RsmA/KsgA/DIM1 with predicted DNA glycosylase/AP lyase activity
MKAQANRNNISQSLKIVFQKHRKTFRHIITLYRHFSSLISAAPLHHEVRNK